MNKLKNFFLSRKITFKQAEKLKLKNKLKIDGRIYEIIKIARDINLLDFHLIQGADKEKEFLLRIYDNTMNEKIEFRKVFKHGKEILVGTEIGFNNRIEITD